MTAARSLLRDRPLDPYACFTHTRFSRACGYCWQRLGLSPLLSWAGHDLDREIAADVALELRDVEERAMLYGADPR